MCLSHLFLGIVVDSDESITFRSDPRGYFQEGCGVLASNSEQMNQFTGNGERQMQMKIQALMLPCAKKGKRLFSTVFS